MATSSYKKWSESKLKAEIKKLNSSLSSYSKKISSLNAKIENAKKAQDTYDQKISELGYSDYVKAVNQAQSEVNKIEKELSKAKKASQKKSLNKKLSSAQKTLSQARKKSSSISSTAKSYAAKKSSKSKYTKSLSKSVKSTKSKKSKAAKKKSAYNKQLAAKKAKKHKQKVAKATSAINKKISTQKTKFGKPHSAMFGYDSESSKVVFLFDTDVSETRSADVTSNAIDKGNPIMDHSRISSVSVSITSKLFGTSTKDINQQYQSLIDWEKNQVVSFEGEIYWRHAVISEVSKTYGSPSSMPDENFYKDAKSFTLGISFNLTYIMFAKVKYTKNKKSKKTKSKGKKQASKSTSKKYVTAKSGTTYWGLSQKYGVSIKKLESWNKQKATAIRIGSKIRVK